MKLPIMQVGEPVLRKQARALLVEEIQSEAIQQLIRDMKETMYDAPGVGLAAPQIGESLQLAVIEDREEYTQKASAEFLQKRGRSPVPFHVIINPKITILKSSTVEFYEGCLSFKGFTGIVPRALEVKVECLDENAKPRIIRASGWYARILQHEIDHLQGKLYIDKVKIRSLSTVENYQRYIAD